MGYKFMIKNKLFFKQKKVLLAICFIIYSFFNSVYAAQQLDKIAAVVGEEIITLSELSEKMLYGIPSI